MKKSFFLILLFLLCCFITLLIIVFVPDGKKVINTTTIIIENDSLCLGKLDSHSKQLASFKIKNTGNELLVIHTVHTSCGCTVATYDKQPIAIGDFATVILEYKPTSLGFFSKTADVICNVPEGFVRLKISGEVVGK